MTLELLGNEYSVYKFGPEYVMNHNFKSSEFFSITKTKDELSIVAKENLFNDYLKVENGWKILKINNILDFSLIGILSQISTILANENISIFVISTYNTDYIMVKSENVNKAIEALLKNNYILQ